MHLLFKYRTDVSEGYMEGRWILVTVSWIYCTIILRTVNQEYWCAFPSCSPGFSAHKNQELCYTADSVLQCLFWAKRHSSAHSVLGESLGKSGHDPRVLLELGLHRARLVWAWLWFGFQRVFFLLALWNCPHLNLQLPFSPGPDGKAGFYIEPYFPLCLIYPLAIITCMLCHFVTGDLGRQSCFKPPGFHGAHGKKY